MCDIYEKRHYNRTHKISGSDENYKEFNVIVTGFFYLQTAQKVDHR